MPRSPRPDAAWADENAASSKQGGGSGGGRQCRAADKILKGRCGCSNGLINSRKFPLNPVCWGSEWRSVRPRVTHLLLILSNSKKIKKDWSVLVRQKYAALKPFTFDLPDVKPQKTPKTKKKVKPTDICQRNSRKTCMKKF